MYPTVPTLTHEFSVLKYLNPEKAVATTQTPRAEPISLAETRRFDGSSDEIGIYAVDVRKDVLHQLGEG